MPVNDCFPLIGPTLLPESPINSALSVRLSVRMERSFLRVGSLLFSEFLHEIRVQETLKSDETLFWEKLLFAQNGIDGTFLGPKWTLLKFSLNFSLRWLFWIFKEDVQNRVNGTFLVPKWTLFNFPLKFFIGFFWSYTQALKIG